MNSNGALNDYKGTYGSLMWLSEESKWKLNSQRIIIAPSSLLALEFITDASETGWSAHTLNHQTGDRWGSNEQVHINVLELTIIFFGLNTFVFR